jgi:hypothetical protein
MRIASLFWPLLLAFVLLQALMLLLILLYL